MTTFNRLKADLRQDPKKWLVTGVAGFIGSNLLEALLDLGQTVFGLDNFETGYSRNLDDVKLAAGLPKWAKFKLLHGDIKNIDDCRRACIGVDYVLHQAALGSVPRSIENPVATNQANVDGFVNMLVASMETGVKRFVFASSSAVYGDSQSLPKEEGSIGNSLSPYAASKLINELYAGVFSRVYGFQWVGLRYFNVFGRRQDPQGAYAAVIPRWVNALLLGERPVINGDGETSRDFCYIDNVVQANLLAAMAENGKAINRAYNIAYGERTTLNELFALIKESLLPYAPDSANIEPVYGPFRQGDIRHSLADISCARDLLGYSPSYSVVEGMKETIGWYVQSSGTKKA